MYDWLTGLILTILSMLSGAEQQSNSDAYSLVYLSEATSQSIFRASEGNVYDFPSFDLKPTPTPTPIPEPTSVPTLAPIPTPVPVIPTQAPVSAATLPVSGGSLTQDQVRGILAQAGFSGQLLEEGLIISHCESTWNSGVANMANTEGPGGSHGLFQIWAGNFATYGYSSSQAYDPVINAIVALGIRNSLGTWGTTQGWQNCAATTGVW